MSLTFVVNFIGILPPPRYDGIIWQNALVYESESETGTFALIDTIDIQELPGGPDEDASEPQYRDLTITNATCAEGFYYIVFEDATHNQSGPTDVFQNAPSVAGSIRPSLEDLGALLHVRTTIPGSAGEEIGTFNSRTRPTAVEAQQLIDNAVNQTLLNVGPNISKAFWEQTKTVILYLTAMLLELSFYKNEISKGISAFPQYKELYEDALNGLEKSINSDTPASATQSFFTVAIVSKAQARAKAIHNATDPKTGIIDLTKLPPDMAWPMGPGEDFLAEL